MTIVKSADCTETITVMTKMVTACVIVALVRLIHMRGVKKMTEKDLDIAIEKCERIMEFDTRTMQNPVSENGWIFEKVYELLQYLRQFQFATDTNVGSTDCISRAAVWDALNGIEISRNASWYEFYQKAIIVVGELPSAQPDHIGEVTEMVGDAISRQALLDTVDGVSWYHQNKNGEMVHGASDKHQAWYKAEDIYKAIESVPSAQPEQFNPCTVCQEFDCTGCKFRRTE